jgi:hypothetical protein
MRRLTSIQFWSRLLGVESRFATTILFLELHRLSDPNPRRFLSVRQLAEWARINFWGSEFRRRRQWTHIFAFLNFCTSIALMLGFLEREKVFECRLRTIAFNWRYLFVVLGARSCLDLFSNCVFSLF